MNRQRRCPWEGGHQRLQLAVPVEFTRNGPEQRPHATQYAEQALPGMLINVQEGQIPACRERRKQRCSGIRSIPESGVMGRSISRHIECVHPRCEDSRMIHAELCRRGRSVRCARADPSVRRSCPGRMTGEAGRSRTARRMARRPWRIAGRRARARSRVPRAGRPIRRAARTACAGSGRPRARRWRSAPERWAPARWSRRSWRRRSRPAPGCSRRTRTIGRFCPRPGT